MSVSCTATVRAKERTRERVVYNRVLDIVRESASDTVLVSSFALGKYEKRNALGLWFDRGDGMTMSVG